MIVHGCVGWWVVMWLELSVVVVVLLVVVVCS